MNDTMIATHLENLDHRLAGVEQILLQSVEPRLARVEQILPTLATKDDLKTLATKDELKALATKDELHAAVALLATKDELHAAVALLSTKEEMREEGERSRRHMSMLIEHQESTIELIAEHLSIVLSKLTDA